MRASMLLRVLNRKWGFTCDLSRASSLFLFNEFYGGGKQHHETEGKIESESIPGKVVHTALPFFPVFVNPWVHHIKVDGPLNDDHNGKGDEKEQEEMQVFSLEKELRDQ
jgi:hypothetical protein